MDLRKWMAGALFLLCLSGCGTEPVQTTLPASSVPKETASEPTMSTTVPPTTEPEVILESGLPVYADGDLLESGTVIAEGVTYMKVSEFLQALDGADYAVQDMIFRLNRLGIPYVFSSGGLTEAGVDTDIPLLTYQKELWAPVEALCGALHISYLFDEAGQRMFCTSTGSGWDWERGVRIPILMYHGVSDDTFGAAELFVRPADLEAQIVYLLDNGYDLITFEDWARLDEFDKPVMLTFDDGYRDNYEELFPILQKYQVKATIFVITGSVDIHDTSLEYMQVRELAQSGLVSIQSHTYTHPHLDECDSETLDREHIQSKLMIARMTGYEPFVMCYPYGDRDSESLEVTREHYRFGLAMNGGLYTTSDEVYEIPRFYVSRYTTLSEFAAMVANAGRE